MGARQACSAGFEGRSGLAWVTAVTLLSLACGDDATATMLGAPCAQDRDCAAGGLVCGLPMSATFDGIGEVITTCIDPQPVGQNRPGDGAPGQPCTAAADCSHRLCALAGTCITPCAGDRDCDSGQSCQALFVTEEGADGALSVHGCTRAVSLGPDITVARFEVGGAVTAEAGEVTLPGTRQPTLFVLAHGGDVLFPRSERCRPPLCPTALRAIGESTPLFDVDNLGPTPPTVPIATPSSSFPLTVYLGSRRDVPHVEAGYTLSLQSEAAGDVVVTSLSGTPNSTRLDLNLFYVTRTWGPGGTRGPDALAAALATVDDIFAQADIFVGEVRQRRVPQALVERGNTFNEPGSPGSGFDPLERRFGVWAELPALFRLSAAADNAAVNVFLLDRIDSVESGGVRGLAGGTPGPWGMHGTGASGVAVAIDGLTSRPEALGRALAHELAHYLGLFHTSEHDGTVLDPLGDTAACTLEDDRDGDGRLDANECAAHGADNLMFWADAGGTALSEEQALILRRALVLQ